MSTYVIALARDKRDTAPPDWQDRIRSDPDVRVQSATPRRVVVDAPARAIPRLQRELGAYCHIEPMVEHRPLDATGGIR